MSHKNNNSNSLGDFLFILLTGVGIGVIASLLYKKNEDEIRSGISRFADDVKGKSHDTYDNVVSTIQHAGDKIRRKSSELIQDGEDQVQEWIDDSSDAKQRAKNDADEAVKDTANNVRRGIKKA
jgi:gas vesicle protein